MSSEREIQEIVRVIEIQVESIYKARFENTPKPPVEDQFKAAAMAEISRRLMKRASKIEEDWLQFTRDT